MASTKWNQDLNAGENWWADFNLKSGDGSTNRNITDHTLASQIKRHYKSVSTKADFRIKVVDATQGNIQMYLTAAQTSALKFGKWVYDVELTDRRGSKVTIAGDGSGAEAVAVVATDGSISAITITDGGSGYTEAPTVTVADDRPNIPAGDVRGSGTTATATITDGVVTDITVTAGGINFVAQPVERVIDGIITIRPEVTVI